MAAPTEAQKKRRAATSSNFILPENVKDSDKPDFPLFQQNGKPLTNSTVQALPRLAGRSKAAGNITQAQMIRVMNKARQMMKSRGLTKGKSLLK